MSRTNLAPLPPDVLAALGGDVTRSGTNWLARCPAHDDAKASLSLKMSNGRPIWNCHAGCSQAKVRAALVAKGAHLGRPKAAARRKATGTKQPGPPPPIPNHPHYGSPAASWRYFDATGALVGAVCRYEVFGQKAIRPLVFDGTDWAWGALPAPRPLYRLPEVLAAPDRPVLVVEGEKTADAAQRTFPDHVVVTWAGAAALELTDWSPVAGRTVTTWADHDEPGRNAMEKLAAILIAAKCAVRRVVLDALGDLPDGWDAADATADQVAAITTSEVTPADCVTIADFVAYLPAHNYIFRPTGAHWPAGSVNAKVPAPAGSGLKPAAWLDQYAAVDQMTWDPRKPDLIEDAIITDNGGDWVEKRGTRVLNTYRAPRVTPGDPSAVAPWLDHLRLVYPNEVDHLVRYCAFLVQRPGEKINHVLLFGGAPGIGKDTILEPVVYAVGAHNFADITPRSLLSQFNPFVKSVLIRINEAHDLGEFDRHTFYEAIKTYGAAPPDSILCNNKFVQPYPVRNCCGLVITTNRKLDGVYLPPDDRRHFVAWSELTVDRIADREAYFDNLYRWFETGGRAHVAAYLGSLDLSEFNPKSPPRKTDAFLEIAFAQTVPENAMLANALDCLGNPDAVLLLDVKRAVATGAKCGDHDLYDYLTDHRNHRKVGHRFAEIGYRAEPNRDATDGLWSIGGTRCAVYVKRDLAPADRLRAVLDLQRDRQPAAKRAPSRRSRRSR